MSSAEDRSKSEYVKTSTDLQAIAKAEAKRERRRLRNLKNEGQSND